MSSAMKNPAPTYSKDLKAVIDAEEKYLRERRTKNHLPAPDAASPLWGICISGGGIRSATLGLGVVQGLIKQGLFKKFDYLSTVSGGGYIGSCLSSLLTGDKSSLSENNSELGVDVENSPLVGLGKSAPEYLDATETRLNVMHQMHHLRTHGEYLTPQKQYTSRDVKRAVGSISSGILHNFLLYLLFLVGFMSFNYGILHFISDGDFFEKIQYQSPARQATESRLDYVLGVLGHWWNQGLLRQLEHVWAGLKNQRYWAFGFLVMGFLVGIYYTFNIRKAIRNITNHRNEPERNQEKRPPSFKSGYNPEDYYESVYTRRQLWLGVFLAPMLSILVGAILKNQVSPIAYWIVFSLPLSYAIGQAVAVYLIIPFLNVGKTGINQRVYRSLQGNVQGGALYSLLTAVLMPLIVLTAFTAGPSVNFLFSVAALAIGYLVFRQKAGGGDSAFYKKLLKTLKIPLLNLSVLLFVGISMAAVGGVLVNREAGLYAFLIFLAASALFGVFGYFVDSNKISPHYFYRDRLSETYLKTDARVKRHAHDDNQGMPLVNLRNDEDLLLKNLGEGNNRGPYHLIVAALNLQGSDELVRRDLKSEHFIFSSQYVGSQSTGYIRTDRYRGGNTKLARAMTISAAAVGSAAGSANAFCHSFLCTLFNLRLGYWIENPWEYRKSVDQDNIPPHRKRQFWPPYLFTELMGNCNARRKMVNVSDGGHTGDNLGLVPLLQRKCKTIVVCDFEQDFNYDFQSFNHAVRMAYIEENVRIDIDLQPLIPKASDKGIGMSEQSVAVGRIYYPNEAQAGQLIYIKSSLSGNLPVHVFNYHKSFPDFPQQSTGDQYFDDSQFEAYRCLGEHMSQEAARVIQELESTKVGKPEEFLVEADAATRDAQIRRGSALTEDRTAVSEG